MAPIFKSKALRINQALSFLGIKINAIMKFEPKAWTKKYLIKHSTLYLLFFTEEKIRKAIILISRPNHNPGQELALRAISLPLRSISRNQ
jgi:hypothetical protein